MSHTSAEDGAGGAGFDLSQFHEIFFEEAGENLDSLEQHLLVIDLVSVDDEVLNAIFRCAHSVKGGAATFGFDDIAELTHQMESLLDKLRRHDLKPTAAMVDVLLQSGDALQAQLARHQGSTSAPLVDIGGTAQVVRVREEFLPVVKLERVFDVRRDGREPEKPILVVVEANGKRLALLVDELLGQQQVVVKNLESNYGKVDNVSGATIIGDGRVALILDVDALVRRSRH